MAFSLGRRKHVPVTWQQRAAGVVLAVLTLIQTPLFSYKIAYSDESVRTRTWSLVEVVAVGLLRTNEQYSDYARAALIPGIFTRTALLQLDACVVQPTAACNWAALKDFDAMWALTDYSDQVPVFVEQLGEYRQYVQAFAAMALVFSFTCIFKDGIMGLFLGYGGVLFVASRSGCDVNGGIVMCVVAVLTAYVMFSKAGEDEEEQGAPAAAGAGAGAGARATPLITPAKEAKKTK